MASNTRNFQRDTQVQFGTTMFGDEVTFNIQMVTLPGISGTNPEIYKNGVKGFVQMDSMDFEDVTLSFIADEEMQVWKQLMGLMFEHIKLPEGTMAPTVGDSWISILSSDGRQVLKVVLYNCSIVNIGALQYDTTTEDEVLVFDATIQYDYFLIEG